MGYIRKIREVSDPPGIEYRQAAKGNYLPGRSMNGAGTIGEQTQPDRIVCHVADGSYPGTLAWFANPDAPASAHFTVAMDGRIGQSVYERDTAYHSGKWSMNVRSFGIEHEGQPSKGPWSPSEAQYAASAKLVATLCYRYDIPVDRTHIIGHNEVDPNRAARRNCPGPTWNWDKYIKMVRDELSKLKGKPPAAAAPGHEKDDYDREVGIMSPCVGLIGRGKLVAGTDKLYLLTLSSASFPLGAPFMEKYRKVRVFNGATNEQVGTGVYNPETMTAHILTLDGGKLK